MSTQQALRPLLVSPRARPRSAVPADRTPWWLRPGWPLAMMFIPFPLWWLLGITEPVTLVAAVAMAVQLLHRRSLAVPRDFGIWLLFLAWVVVGIVVVQVDAPGAIPGVNHARYLTWGFRLLWYLKATVVLLYIGNTRSRLSLARVSSILSWMFVWIVLGGVLGALKPGLDFPSVLEALLPHRYTSVEFVRSLVHPNLAEYVSTLGVPTARPSAPFAFTNVWGLNFVCFLPFFVCSWLARDAGWRRLAAPVVLLVALVPVIYSLNRGMWAALIVCALFLALRSAIAGNLKVLGGLLVGAVIVAALIAVTPLGGSIQARFNNPNSNDGRAQLAALGFRSVIDRSPVVGFGSTRYVQGSFTSIAGGASPTCPRCSPPSLGTQGQLSLVVFCQGLVGAFLYIAFIVLQLLRHIRLKSPYAAVGLSVLLMHLVTLSVYSVDNMALLPLFIAIGFLWRISSDEQRAQRHHGAVSVKAESTLLGYRQLLRRSRSILIVAMLIGALAGAGWHLHRGTTVTATVSVLLPAEPSYPGPHLAPATPDTLAQLLDTEQVQDAVANTAEPALLAGGGLSVTADPNTRILNVSYTAYDAPVAATAANTAVKALLDVRKGQLVGLRDAALVTLRAQAAQDGAAVNTVDQSVKALDGVKGRAARTELALLHQHRDDLVVDLRTTNSAEQEVRSTQLNPGHVVKAATMHPARHVWAVPMASGAMLGLLAGLALGLLRGRRTGRIRDLEGLATATTLPVRQGALPDSERMLDGQPTVYLGIGSDRVACRVAAELDSTLHRSRPAAAGGQPSEGQRVILVASPRTRVGEIEAEQLLLADMGLETVGVVLVDA